jgi:serine/threonine protein kinase
VIDESPPDSALSEVRALNQVGGLGVEPPPGPLEIEAQRVRATVQDRLFGTTSEPVRVGRYEIESRLGQGGMGVVYLARDVQLGRKVAVKVLHVSDAGTAGGSNRLLREAQSLARLSHPNVVQIFEVGEHDDQVFVAMEFVQGRTLGDLTPGPEGEDSIDSILDAFCQAGLGLAAAHESGLIHRDFKPDNAMIGEAGRVRVLDFGLAREEGDLSLAALAKVSDLDESLDDTGVSATDATLKAAITRAGVLVGTPAYISPEQYLGASATPKSDQFAFCVSLWERLYGNRPFGARTLVRLAEAITTGRISAPSRARGVPFSVRRALRRGLRVDPDLRYPTMRELVDVLSPAKRRERRRLFGAVGVLGVAASLALWSLPNSSGSAGDPATEVDETEAGRIARLLTRAAMRNELAKYDEGYEIASQARDAARAAGDGAAEGRALTLMGRASEELGDTKRALDLIQRGAELSLAAGDTPSYAAATTWLAWRYARDSKLERADAAVAKSEETLRQLGHVPVLEASLQEAKGEIAVRRGDLEASIGFHREALRLRHDELGDRHYKVAISKNNVANGLMRQGNYAEARSLMGESAEVQEALRGPSHPHLATILSNMGAVDIELGREAEDPERRRELLGRAEGELGRALALREEGQGAGHKSTVYMRQNLGEAYLELGELEPARREFLAALKLKEEHYPKRRASLATTLTSLAKVELASSDFVAAELHLTRALEIREGTDGSAPEDLGEVRFQLAKALRGRSDPGDEARALELAQQAEADFETAGSRFAEELEEVAAWLEALAAERSR